MTDDLDDLEPIDLTTTPPASTWPEGWYADPWTAGQYRYWSGQTWTGATHRWGPANAAASGVTTEAWPAVPVSSHGFRLPTTPAPDVVPPLPPRRRDPIVAAVVALVAVLVASGAIGYAINASSQPERVVQVAPAPSTTTPSTGGGRAAPPDPGRRVLGSMVVRQADVGAARTVLLYQKGNSLDEPTLDLCNGTYPSEALRTARLQLLDVDASGNASLSTEAVLYRSPKAAEQAVTELQKVRASCPHKPVRSPVDGTSEETEFKAPPDLSWSHNPAVERQAYRIVTTAGGRSSAQIVVYLRRGRALLGLYFPQPDGKQPPLAGRTSVPDIVFLFEARMAELPASVVNATI